jgi:[ribosomal protein S5]-alanine N-acetyltransferase
MAIIAPPVPFPPKLAEALAAGDFDQLPDLVPPKNGEQWLREIAAATADHYRRVPPEAPWVGYLLVDGAQKVVGTAAFVRPPSDRVVEIAYHTYPECEGRGIAGASAAALIEIARQSAEVDAVIAHTARRANASTRILERLGFRRSGEAQDVDAGTVWCWRLELARS